MCRTLFFLVAISKAINCPEEFTGQGFLEPETSPGPCAGENWLLAWTRCLSVSCSWLINLLFNPTCTCQHQPNHAQLSCFFASVFRLLYFIVGRLHLCNEGGPCLNLIFESGNVPIISSALLTVMFWKKLNVMYGGSGVKLANQRKHDLQFASILGFYISFQFTTIVGQVRRKLPQGWDPNIRTAQN